MEYFLSQSNDITLQNILVRFSSVSGIMSHCVALWAKYAFLLLPNSECCVEVRTHLYFKKKIYYVTSYLLFPLSHFNVLCLIVKEQHVKK